MVYKWLFDSTSFSLLHNTKHIDQPWWWQVIPPKRRWLSYCLALHPRRKLPLTQQLITVLSLWCNTLYPGNSVALSASFLVFNFRHSLLWSSRQKVGSLTAHEIWRWITFPIRHTSTNSTDFCIQWSSASDVQIDVFTLSWRHSYSGGALHSVLRSLTN